MRSRFLPLVALLAVAFPVAARAQDEAPSLIVRVRSIDSLMDDAKYMVTLVGQEELAKQMDGFLKSMVGAKGLEGIDTKKPMAFYGTVGANFIDSTGVLMVPIADEKAFLALLDRLNLGVQKGEGGIYTFTPPNSPTDAYFRFANNYVYVTAQTKSAIDKNKLLTPATVLPGNPAATLSITMRFDRIPDAIKQLALGQMEMKLADEADKKLDNETEAQQKFRVAVMKEMARRITQLFKEGGAMTINVDVDRKNNELVTDLTLQGKSGSKLASDIAELGQSKTLFLGALGTDSAMNGLLHIVLPAEVTKALGPVYDEGVKQALDKEKDEAKREAAKKFLDVLGPTFKAGDLDLAFSLRGPSKDNRYGVVGGMKVKDGAAIDKAFRTLVKGLKQEEQDKIEFDADSVGAVKIHKFKIEKDIDDKAKALFGVNPLYLALRSDAVLIGFGEGGLSALKEAIAAKPQEGPQFQFEMSVRRLGPALEREHKEAAKLIEDAFGKTKDADRIRFTVEGGKALKVRFTMKAQVVKFFVLLAQVQKGNAEQ
ncbi:MAG: hypothetical protein K2R98_03375 [Gemmataceae bacterium]|nr:hypothetical protein [Gemmataceae bacterium]